MSMGGLCLQEARMERPVKSCNRVIGPTALKTTEASSGFFFPRHPLLPSQLTLLSRRRFVQKKGESALPDIGAGLSHS